MKNKQIKQYNMVVLLRDYPEYDFIKDDIGVVVEIYKSNDEQFGYLVEVMREGKTIGVELIDINDMDLVKLPKES